MDMTIEISVWDEDGYEKGQAEVMTFDEDFLLEALRQASSIPTDKQKHWEITGVNFK